MEPPCQQWPKYTHICRTISSLRDIQVLVTLINAFIIWRWKRKVKLLGPPQHILRCYRQINFVGFQFDNPKVILGLGEKFGNYWVINILSQANPHLPREQGSAQSSNFTFIHPPLKIHIHIWIISQAIPCQTFIFFLSKVFIHFHPLMFSVGQFVWLNAMMSHQCQT